MNTQQLPLASHQQSATRTLAIIGLILAFVVAPAGLVISIIALVKIIKSKQNGKGIAIAGTIIGLVLTSVLIFLVLVVGTIFSALGFGHGNEAESKAASIATALEQVGGRKICDNGDSGWGIDNTIPWYDVYYEVNSSPDPLSKIKGIAAPNGYNLTPVIGKKEDRTDNPSGTSLSGENNGKKLDVNIFSNGQIPLYCGGDGYNGKYGDEYTIKDGKTVVEFNLTLPDTSKQRFDDVR